MTLALTEPPPEDYEPPEPAHEHVPSHDPAAERAVLGAILVSKRALDETSTLIAGSDFYRPAHEAIWEAAIHLYARLEPVDVITVGDELAKRRQLAKIGGTSELHRFALECATPGNAAYYAGIIAEHAVRRRVAEAGTRLTQLARADMGADLLEVGGAHTHANTPTRHASQDATHIDR